MGHGICEYINYCILCSKSCSLQLCGWLVTDVKREPDLLSIGSVPSGSPPTLLCPPVRRPRWSTQCSAGRPRLPWSNCSCPCRASRMLGTRFCRRLPIRHPCEQILLIPSITYCYCITVSWKLERKRISGLSHPLSPRNADFAVSSPSTVAEIQSNKTNVVSNWNMYVIWNSSKKHCTPNRMLQTHQHNCVHIGECGKREATYRVEEKSIVVCWGKRFCELAQAPGQGGWLFNVWSTGEVFLVRWNCTNRIDIITLYFESLIT